MIFWLFLGALALYFLFMFLADRFEAVELAKEKAFRKPISLEEVETASRLMEDATLPMVTLEPIQADDVAPLDTKLAGLPWVPDAAYTWPLTEAGAPMSFLAQINFAQLPEMPDFPKKGLLQVFADVTAMLKMRSVFATFAPKDNDLQHVIRWFPDPIGGHELERPDDVNREPDRLIAVPLGLFMGMDDDELDEVEDGPTVGCAVKTKATSIKPPVYSLPKPHNALYCNDYGAAPRPVLTKKAARALRALENESTDLGIKQRGHRVGGHPIYLGPKTSEVVNDADLDRVLLHLRYQLDAKGIQNEYMTLAVSQDDLRAGNIAKAQFFWSDGTFDEDD